MVLNPERWPVWAGLTQMWEPLPACERGRAMKNIAGGKMATGEAVVSFKEPKLR